MKSVRAVMLCFIAAATAAPVLFAQGVQSLIEYSNPPFGVGARMAALAESDISEARDVSGMYWNPASLSELARPTMVATYQRTRNIENYVGAVSYRIDKENVVAVGGLLTSFPAQTAGVSAERTPMQGGVDIGFAHNFTYALSVGVRLSGRYGQAEGFSNGIGSNGIQAGFGSVGIFYMPVPNFTYAAVYNNIGTGVVYANDGQTTTFQSQHLPGSIEVGVAMRYPSMAKYRLLTVTISNEKIIDDHDMRYKFGIELLPWTFAALRFGYYVEPTASRPTYGLGFRLNTVGIDYAYVPHKYREELHQVSLTAIF